MKSCFFLSCLWINFANINSEIRQKIISILIQFKNERLTEILRLSDATFYDRINAIYQIIKKNSWIKYVYFWGLYLFVCHYWQWPILINCVMCYYLCVLRWLMRPILALNCLLQMEQERSVGDALALAFCFARFCSASLILFASYSSAPLFMRPRHFVRSCAICSHDSVGMLKSLREALRVSLYRFFWPPWERFPTWSSP